MVATAGFAQHVLTCSSASSRCLLDFSYGSNQGLPNARIECDPSGANNDPELRFHTAGSSLLMIQNDLITAYNPLTVNGAVTATSVVTPDVMPRSEIIAGFQPLLSSAIDDAPNGIHSVLGYATAAGTTKCITGAAGAVILSTFHTIAVNTAPCTGFVSTLGFDQLSSSCGMSSYPSGTWGDTFAPVKHMHSTTLGVNQASSAYAEWAIPTGSKTAFFWILQWQYGSSVDWFGHNGGAEIWLNRISFGQTSTTTLPNRYSGNRIECIASKMDMFTHIVLRVVRGTARILSISFHFYDRPVVSSCHVPTSDALSDGRIKTAREERTGLQAIGSMRGIRGYTYDRDDLKQRRLGLIADEVQAAVASELPPVEHIVGSTMASPGEDMPYGPFLTLSYDRLTALLIPAVNELSKQVAELKLQLESKAKRKRSVRVNTWALLVAPSLISTHYLH